MIKNKKHIKSFAGFFSIISFLVLFLGMGLLAIESIGFYYTGVEKFTLYNFLFEFQKLSMETSSLAYDESKNIRLYGLFIPLIIFVLSVVTYLFTRKNEKTHNKTSFFNALAILGFSAISGILFIVTIPLVLILFYLSKRYKISEKFLKSNHNHAFNNYLIREKNIIPDKKIMLQEEISNKYKYFTHYKTFTKKCSKYNIMKEKNKKVTFIKKGVLLKTILFLCLIQFLAIFFVLNISGNIIGKNNHYLNNNTTRMMNSVIGNGCLTGKNEIFYNLSVEDCYHDKFDENINDSKILFLSLIDKNGGILDFSNYQYVIESLTDATDKDKIYLYQKTFEGLVAKNKQFKTQKYYDKNKKQHNIGDTIIEREEKFYNLSKKLNTEDFVNLIINTEDKKQSIILSRVFGEVKKSDMIYSPITMQDIKKIEYNFHNITNDKEYNKRNLYADIFLNYKRFLKILETYFFTIKHIF
jgi:hypothetical protein